MPANLYARWGKRVLDLVLGSVLLLLAAFVMLPLAVAIRLKLGAGVVFRQQRVGRDGRPFTIYKFRTMTPDRRRESLPFEGPDRRECHKRDDDPRHTGLGRFLRRWRLDELPQFWNVVRGDMSLVGPRPELVEVVGRYEPWQHDRHLVKPGITGLWQVSPHAQVLASEGVDFDLAYVRRLSLRTDCGVLLRTPLVMLRRSGH